MQQILVYADSLSWGIIPRTRQRLAFDERWPGVMESGLHAAGLPVRVIEDCLNGRRTVFEDPYKPGRNGLARLPQTIECHSPLDLVILMLGTNDLQSMHAHNAWHAATGVATLVAAVRSAPIEPGMPVPPVLVVAPPPLRAPSGPIAPKFEGGERKCFGLARAYHEMCEEVGCHYFDAGSVVATSPLDGVHLDAAEHATLGRALAQEVASLLRAAAPAG